MNDINKGSIQVYCCVRCFSNKHIVWHIKKNGSVSSCDYCKASRVTVIHVERLGTFIRERLLATHKNASYEVHPYFNDFNGGMSVRDILDDECVFPNGVESNSTTRELFRDLLKPYDIDEPNGDIDYLEEGDAVLLEKDDYLDRHNNPYTSAWKLFKHQVKHFSRFFDISSKSITRKKVLKPISAFFKELEYVLPKGTELWRARSGFHEITNDYFSISNEIGPPPPISSKHNRMSPAGIPCFYCAEDIKTAIAEIRPNLGSKIIAGKFVTQKELRILDLTKIPNIRAISIFDSRYQPARHFARGFMQDFIQEISSPISEFESPIEYLPTQVLSEFIRSQGFDGVRYNSSLNEGGTNFTLFCGPEFHNYRIYAESFLEYEYPVEYFDLIPQFLDWVRLAHVRYFRAEFYSPFYELSKSLKHIDFSLSDHISGLKSHRPKIVPFSLEKPKRQRRKGDPSIKNV